MLKFMLNLDSSTMCAGFASRLFAFAGFVGMFLLLACEDADAYLDPGSGSYLFQIAIAGIVGAGFAIKMYWKKITSLITGLFKK